MVRPGDSRHTEEGLAHVASRGSARHPGIAISLVKLLSYKAVELTLLGRAEPASSAALDRQERLLKPMMAGSAARWFGDHGAPQLAQHLRVEARGWNFLVHPDHMLATAVVKFVKERQKDSDSFYELDPW